MDLQSTLKGLDFADEKAGRVQARQRECFFLSEHHTSHSCVVLHFLEHQWHSENSYSFFPVVASMQRKQHIWSPKKLFPASVKKLAQKAHIPCVRVCGKECKLNDHLFKTTFTGVLTNIFLLYTKRRPIKLIFVSLVVEQCFPTCFACLRARPVLATRLLVDVLLVGFHLFFLAQ